MRRSLSIPHGLYPVLGVKCHGKDRGTNAFMAYGHVEEIAQAQRILGKLPLIPLGWRMTASCSSPAMVPACAPQRSATSTPLSAPPSRPSAGQEDKR